MKEKCTNKYLKSDGEIFVKIDDVIKQLYRSGYKDLGDVMETWKEVAEKTFREQEYKNDFDKMVKE